MNDRSFTKLFSCIVTSSMWSEDSDTRVVWITILALANSHGEVLAALPGLARAANVPLETCAKAVSKFQEPDKYSRTSANDGRRIEKIEGGWKILNYALYRRMMSEAERREYMRDYMDSYRKNPTKPRKTSVNNCKQSKHIAEAEAEAEADNNPAVVPVPCSIPSAPPPEMVAFEKFWSAYPRKTGKSKALLSFHKRKCTPLIDKILTAIEEQRKGFDWTKDGGRFIPHPTTWLNQGRWEDEVFVPKEAPVTNGNGNGSHVAQRISLENERERIQAELVKVTPQYDFDDTSEKRKRRREIKDRTMQIDGRLGELNSIA